jgi:alpha-1,2-mannosyltransferase
MLIWPLRTDRRMLSIMPERPFRTNLLKFVMLASVAAAGPWVVYRACVNGGSDFPEFRRAGQFVVEHGTRHPRSNLYRYLPSLDVACIPLTWIPIGISAAVWYALNAACWMLMLETIRRDLLAGSDPNFAGEVTLAAGLLGLPLAIDGFLLGGFHVLMLWLMIAGILRAVRGGIWTGGLLLGLATWLKLLPIFGIGYLIWLRKWKSATVAVLTVLVIDAALSLPAYGWYETCELHSDWFWREAIGTSDRQLAGDTNDDEDRVTNQSLIVVLRRVLTDRGGFPQLSAARLSENQMTVVALATLAILATGVLIRLRTKEFSLPRDTGGDIALVCLCTLWFSPVVWSYHLIAAVPATAVVLARRPRAWQRWTIIGVWCLGLALFTVELGRAAGHMLWVTFVVGGCLAWCMRTASRAGFTMSLMTIKENSAAYEIYGREIVTDDRSARHVSTTHDTAAIGEAHF